MATGVRSCEHDLTVPVLTLGVRSARRNPFGPDEDPILDEPDEPVHGLVEEQPLPVDSEEG